jgi:hypothetical protein
MVYPNKSDQTKKQSKQGIWKSKKRKKEKKPAAEHDNREICNITTISRGP